MRKTQMETTEATLNQEYEKFIKEGQKYLDKQYFLQTYETDNEYTGCYAKIRDNNTTFIEKSVNDKKMNHLKNAKNIIRRRGR